jgi:uroporphyrinogen decarboxylase
MEATWEGFGIEMFSRILAKPKQAKKLFDDRGKCTLELTKIYAENEAKAIWVYDDYGYKTGMFMSPQNYRKYVIPWMKQICEAAHKRDCKLILHSCGDIEPIFGDLVDAGVDAFNPLEATTANPEYDIFKLNNRFGDKTTFIGNIAPQMLSTGTNEEIRDYSKKLIRELAPGGGFIFASGHSINPAVPLEHFQILLDVREKYGYYPINVPD